MAKNKIPQIQMMLYYISMFIGLFIVFSKDYLLDIIVVDKNLANNLFRILTAICAFYASYISYKLYMQREEEDNSIKQ